MTYNRLRLSFKTDWGESPATMLTGAAKGGCLGNSYDVGSGNACPAARDITKQDGLFG